MSLVERQFAASTCAETSDGFSVRARSASCRATGGFVVGMRAAEADVRRRVAAVAWIGRAERARRVGVLVLFEEQLAPRGLQLGIVARHRGRVAEQVVGLLHAPEGVRGAGRAAGGSRRRSSRHAG